MKKVILCNNTLSESLIFASNWTPGKVNSKRTVKLWSYTICIFSSIEA